MTLKENIQTHVPLWSSFKMNVKNAFRTATSILHGLAGFIAGIVNVLPYGWTASLALTLVYFVYQALEAESPIDSYVNLTEFICGFIIAIPVIRLFLVHTTFISPASFL